MEWKVVDCFHCDVYRCGVYLHENTCACCHSFLLSYNLQITLQQVYDRYGASFYGGVGVIVANLGIDPLAFSASWTLKWILFHCRWLRCQMLMCWLLKWQPYWCGWYLCCCDVLQQAKSVRKRNHSIALHVCNEKSNFDRSFAAQHVYVVVLTNYAVDLTIP